MRIDPKTDQFDDLIFEAIDGFGDGEVYVAGWDGVLALFNGTDWQVLDSPTNHILTCMVCAGDGQVYVAGRRGTLVAGRGETRWRLVDAGIRGDIWSVAWFQDRLWLATQDALWTWQPGAAKAEPYTDFGDEDPGTFNHLATGHGMLLSTAPDDVLLFDGTSWRRIE
jgi:hypothetical protein